MKYFALLTVLLTATVGYSLQPAESFVSTGEMSRPRNYHTATLLNDGRVLIAGGISGDFTDSAEIFDPRRGTFSPTGSMHRLRAGHFAVLLPDGRVLVAGGMRRTLGEATIFSVEIYDPETAQFTNMRELDFNRTNYPTLNGICLLDDGRVLLVGQLETAIYDPIKGNLVHVGSYIPNYFTGTPLLLRNGKVLIAGSSFSLFNPNTGSFRLLSVPTAIASPKWEREILNLTDGSVLIAGGQLLDSDENGFTPAASAELFDPGNESFRGIQPLENARLRHKLTLLPDGSVLVTGGANNEGISFATSETFAPATGTFVQGPSMTESRSNHTSTLLTDGRVLITGGETRLNCFGGGDCYRRSAEIYTPAKLVPAARLLEIGERGQGAVLHSGTGRIASSTDPASSGEILEIYLTGLTRGSAIPPQVSIGGRWAEVLYFGEAPGHASLNQINIRVPAGLPTGDAIPLRIHDLSRPSNTVFVGVR